MAQELHILLLEDSPEDAELIEMELREGGIAFKSLRVHTRRAFEEALRGFAPDLILADYLVPVFNGMAALELARKRCPDTPFILVSGKITEETLVETLKSGAADYVVKDNLSRLVHSVRRALDQARERTERKRLEDRFQQAQKMESIGRLAGGVAHDFSNLLTVISGYSELLLASLEPDDQRRDDVEEIKKTVYRAASLTRQLLAFSKKQMIQPKVLDLNTIVSNMEKMLRRLIGEDIEMTTALDPQLGRVLADEGQLEQILLNLTVNARDAMPEGGRVTVQTSNAELGENYREFGPDFGPGRCVSLTVSDTGCGMDPETISHLFEPFFTTKKTGTGLGLSTVYGIVQQFGGHVEVQSKPEKGTTFRVYFPPVEAALEAAGEAPVPIASLRGDETILLVDDDQPLRKLALRILSKSGYTVLEAATTDEAERLCQGNRGPVKLLLTDVIMPKMNGPELAAKLTALRPEMKVLFMSGYTDERIKAYGLQGPDRSFLPKPFAPNDLLRKVREMLGLPPSRTS